MNTYSCRRNNKVIFCLFVILAILIAYLGTLQSPFIFDDLPNIVENPSIRTLWPFWSAFKAPVGITGIAGRPIINLTLAINYAISEEAVWSYHAFNIAFHMMAALFLFGIVRRTLLWDRFKQAYDNNERNWIAFACSILWALHPLQTQSVTYIIQRCESLMGLFFLLTFYSAIRGWQSSNPIYWHSLSISAFLLGVGSKEVIITAPILLLIYDAFFRKTSWRYILRSSPLLYFGLFIGTILLAILILSGRTASSGTGNYTFSVFQYWMTQTNVILHYVRISLWPTLLVFDYQWPISTLWESMNAIIILMIVIALSVRAILKRKVIGFLSAWVFFILAPTSIFPLPDVASEHRMYLPLVAIVIIIVFSVYYFISFAIKLLQNINPEQSLKIQKYIFVLLVLLTAIIYGILTFERNLVYSSGWSIWNDTLKKRPANNRAMTNLGNLFLNAGRPDVAVVYYQEALRILNKKDQEGRESDRLYSVPFGRNALAEAHINIASAYLGMGKLHDAKNHLDDAMKYNPNDGRVHNNLGIYYFHQKEPGLSLSSFREAVRLRPHSVNEQINLGTALRLQGKPKEAIILFQKALQIARNSVQAHYGMAMSLMEIGEEKEALDHFQRVLILDPEHAPSKEKLNELKNKSR
jgi:tetratricopeptide (TPR) repeat protein